ncbi:MAG TPA: hypothetical protein VNW97_20700 [Candidatus Saccharimonadales bacterium]|jgi:hypothetical protein|nr:hypothetical protein [Candidatus Saccharimonadales bacterium]
MKIVEDILRQTIVAVVCLATMWQQDAGSASITGHVQLSQTSTSLVARLYSPKSQDAQAQQNKQMGEGPTRRVRVSFIQGDGRFEFPGLLSGSYLLEIYSGDRLLYQKIVSTQDTQPLEIALNAIQESSQPSLVFKKKGWRPGDMTSDPSSGVFVLDSSGGVSKLSSDEQIIRIEPLFRLNTNYEGSAVTASAQSVYVVANSTLGCLVLRYSLSDKAMSERLLGVKETCTGIATDGTTIYVTLPQKNEIRYLRSWNSSYRSWSVNGADALGPIVFDHVGNRLIVADHSGRAYAISTADGTKELLASNLGWVNSIAASRQHILVASGSKVLSLTRSDNRGENPPMSLRSLTGGHIVGVAVDAGDRAWFADYDKEVVQGFLPLN